MADAERDALQDIVAPNPVGAFVTTARTERVMKYYPFCDSDLDNIGTLSVEINALMAMGGTFLCLAVTSIVELVLTTDAIRSRVFTALLWISVAFMVLCVAGVWRNTRKRKSVIERVKHESTTATDALASERLKA